MQNIGGVMKLANLTQEEIERIVLLNITMRSLLQDRTAINTLHKDLVMKYAKAEKRLVELNNLKNKFLGMAAHDLRNPLGSIMGFAEILANGMAGEIGPQQKEFLDHIVSSSKQMLTLLNDLLDISVIESGRIDIVKQTASLTALISERVRLNEIIASKKEIAFVTDFAPVPDLPLDTARIAQVIDNILSNAIKFSPRGSTIRVTVGCTQDTVSFSVADQGPGLSPDDKEKLFGDFQKLSAKPTGGEKSTGLGLAIVKKIVSAHGGTIRVNSEFGKGAEFIVTLQRSTIV